MTEDAVMTKGTVMLQNCTVAVEAVPGSCSQTAVTSSDDTHAAIGINVEEDKDLTVKVEEIPEPISFPSYFVNCIVPCIVCDDNVLFYVLFDCVVLYIVMYVNVYYCHRVPTQLQLNISYHIKAEPQEVSYCLCPLSDTCHQYPYMSTVFPDLHLYICSV
jgi:hypothetical protein